MIEMNIEEANRAVDGTLVTGAEPVDADALVLDEVHSDSRIVARNGLFVAIRGERVDGHDFIGTAAANGYVAALVDHEVEDSPIVQILVPDTVAALQKLAHHNLEKRRAMRQPFTVIGITGSVGKTTTKDLTRALLSHAASTVAPEGSRNNDIGMPLTALEVNGSTRYLVSEMGANKMGDIARLTRVARPDVAVELRVGTAHIGQFGSRENIFLAKSELVEALEPDGVALLNADDERVARMTEKTQARTILWFGLHEHEGRRLTVTARDIGTDAYDRAAFTLVIEGQEVGRVHLRIAGRHHVINALAAASVAHVIGMEDQDIVDVLDSPIHVSPHRMNVADSPVLKGLVVIDDTYNANLDSMNAGLAALKALGDKGAWKVAVLGPMLELGDEAVRIHEQVGQQAAQDADELISLRIADQKGSFAWARAFADGFSQAAPASPTHIAANIDEAQAILTKIVAAHEDSGTVALLKGSLGAGLEPMADRLLGRSTKGDIFAGQPGVAGVPSDPARAPRDSDHSASDTDSAHAQEDHD